MAGPSGQCFKFSKCVFLASSLVLFKWLLLRWVLGRVSLQHEPLKTGFSVCYSSLDLVDTSPIGFQSPIFGGWGITSQLQVLKVGVPAKLMGYRPFAPQGEAPGL